MWCRVNVATKSSCSETILLFLAICLFTNLHESGLNKVYFETYENELFLIIHQLVLGFLIVTFHNSLKWDAISVA